MTDDSKSGQNRPDETDPLSATAMFLRALDQGAEAKQPEPAAAKVDSGNAADQRGASPVGSRPGGRGEFTEIFGRPAQPSPEPSFAMGSAPTQQPPPAEPVRPAEPAGSQAPGEFTRIFVKASTPSARPAANNIEDRPEAAPSPQARPKGFSSPGVSDAASGETGFTQIFKPVPGARGAGSPAQPVVPSPRPEAVRSEAQFGRPGDAPQAKPDQSITSLIESLSSSSAPSGPRAPEPAPYRPDPLAHQPIAKPAPASDFDPGGGVTRFIQRLSDAPAQPEPAPPPTPVRGQNSGPGEFTRVISAMNSPAISTPPAPPPAPAEAPAPGISFARPSIPPLPQSPIQVAMPPAAAPVAPAAPVFTAPPVPAPRLPAAPPAPTVAAPKGKLEALVPMLLVVNTFLLVIILVVMIFSIKGR